MATLNDLAQVLLDKSTAGGFDFARGMIVRMQLQDIARMPGMLDVFERLNLADVPEKELRTMVGNAVGSSGIGWKIGGHFLSFKSSLTARPDGLINGAQIVVNEHDYNLDHDMELMEYAPSLGYCAEHEIFEPEVIEEWVDCANDMIDFASDGNAHLENESDFGIVLMDEQQEFISDFDPAALEVTEDDVFHGKYDGKDVVILPIAVDTNGIVCKKSAEEQLAHMQENGKKLGIPDDVTEAFTIRAQKLQALQIAA